MCHANKFLFLSCWLPLKIWTKGGWGRYLKWLFLLIKSSGVKVKNQRNLFVFNSIKSKIKIQLSYNSYVSTDVGLQKLFLNFFRLSILYFKNSFWRHNMRRRAKSTGRSMTLRGCRGFCDNCTTNESYNWVGVSNNARSHLCTTLFTNTFKNL